LGYKPPNTASATGIKEYPGRSPAGKIDYMKRGKLAMGLNKKPYIEQSKLTAESKLDARVALLKSRGMEESSINKEMLVKKFKAEIRQARIRLASIAAQEKLTQDLAAMKAQKAEAEKAAKEAPPAKQAKTAKKSEKAGKGEKGEKGEKKAKKAKPESAAE